MIAYYQKVGVMLRSAASSASVPQMALVSSGRLSLQPANRDTSRHVECRHTPVQYSRHL